MEAVEPVPMMMVVLRIAVALAVPVLVAELQEPVGSTVTAGVVPVAFVEVGWGRKRDHVDDIQAIHLSVGSRGTSVVVVDDRPAAPVFVLAVAVDELVEQLMHLVVGR